MKKLKRWKRIYFILMIFIYAVFIPVTTLEWLFADGSFPITAIAVGSALPVMKKNHLNQLEQQAV